MKKYFKKIRVLNVAISVIGFLAFLFSVSIAAADVSEFLDGKYIGHQIEYLSEKEVFLQKQKVFNIKENYMRKLLSGELHPDGKIDFKLENTEEGYRAFFSDRGGTEKSEVAEWSVRDITDEIFKMRFVSSSSEVPLIDFSDHACWFKLKLRNEKNEKIDAVVEIDRHFSGRADLYVIRENRVRVFRADFTQTMTERGLPSKNPAFRVEIIPGENVFFMRIDNDGWPETVPVRLWAYDEFIKHGADEGLFQGILVGVFVIIFIYNLVFFILIRDTSYFYISLLVLSQLLIHVCVSGFGFQYFWPDSPLTGPAVLSIVWPFQICVTLLLGRVYVATYRNTPLVDKVLLWMAGLTLFCGMVFFVLPSNLKYMAIGITFIFDMLFYLPLVYSSIIAIRKGNRTGIFLIAALAFYFLSNIEWVLSNFNILPYEMINYVQLKGVSFVLLMTLGLVYKVNDIRKRLHALNVSAASGANAIFPNEGHSERQKTLTETTKIKIETVIEYIRKNYMFALSREGLAYAAGMSPDHLGRMFKKFTGERISDYINRLRVEEAAEKLLATDEKIITIAYDVGFDSLRTFNGVFMNVTGESPSQYRKRNK